MNREEMLAWAKSLNPGDEVAYDDPYGRVKIVLVEKVTPKVWVKTENGMTFSQNKWSNYLYQRGGLGRIMPIDGWILRKIKKQEYKRDANCGGV